MKFRDKDGNVFEDIDAARSAYCHDKAHCDECALGKEAVEPINACYYMTKSAPAEAARLMGYEVVEDAPSKDTGDVEEVLPCRWCKDEICVNADSPMRADYCPVPDTPLVCLHEDRNMRADMDKQNEQKPRICEVLGVEVGERFSYIQRPHINIWFTETGSYCCEPESADVLSYIFACINKPENIIRQPRFTEEEVADARALIRLHGDGELYRVGGETFPVKRVFIRTKDCHAQLRDGLFPSIIRSGQSVKLSEIVGCEE